MRAPECIDEIVSSPQLKRHGHQFRALLCQTLRLWRIHRDAAHQWLRGHLTNSM